jgi:hypothetical protein
MKAESRDRLRSVAVGIVVSVTLSLVPDWVGYPRPVGWAVWGVAVGLCAGLGEWWAWGRARAREEAP